MTDLEWQGDGPVFTILSGGRTWTLDLDSTNPCLAWSDERSIARLLGLDHVARVGRRDEAAFDGSLVAFERHRGRIQATYAPRAWHGLNVRAAWGPTLDHDGFDMEVQVWATSSGVLRRLEVAVESRWLRRGTGVISTRHTVAPRDVPAAAMSYDGREPVAVLRRLTTMPVPDRDAPIDESLAEVDDMMIGPDTPAYHLLVGFHTIPSDRSDPRPFYEEMVRPMDCARRITNEIVQRGDRPRHPEQSIRYGLFGHDLEKGVVLRGRIRGVWAVYPPGLHDRDRRHQAFLDEPLPLGP